MRRIKNYAIMEDVFLCIIDLATGSLLFFGTKEQSKDYRNWQHNKHDVDYAYKLYMEDLK